MDQISLGGRPIAGFLLDDTTGSSSSGATPVLAAAMTGATVGLLAYVFKAPVGVSLLAGTGAAIVTKLGIDRAAKA